MPGRIAIVEPLLLLAAHAELLHREYVNLMEVLAGSDATSGVPQVAIAEVEAQQPLARVAAAALTDTLVAAYAGWIRAKARGRAYERDFLSKAFLSAQTLRQISEMRQQYVELLDQIGFLRSGAGLFQRNSGEPVDTIAAIETGEKTNDVASSELSAAAAP